VVVHVRRRRPRCTTKQRESKRGRAQGVVVRGALDPVRVQHANAMLCAHAPGRTWSRTPRGRDMPYGLCPAQALWQSGSRWSRPGRAGGRRRRASWVSRSRADRGAAVLCVCSALGRCVSWRLAWRLTNSRDVALSAPCRRPNHHESLTCLLSSPILSPLDSHDTANTYTVYVHIYPWAYGNKRQRQQSTARRPFSHLSISL
jgi:hypothetical protein